jgi:ribosomal protein S18 acetylase RimI-like enzyme
MEIREATIEHAEAIADVHVASWRAAYAGLMPAEYLAGLSVVQRAASWRKALAAGRPRVALAFEDARLAGWAAYGPSRDEDKDADWGEIESIYLRPAFWRRGIGERLVGRACDALRAAGYRQVSLWVLCDNLAARSFYERLGFACDGLVKTFELGGALLRETRYCFDLGSGSEPAPRIVEVEARDLPELRRLTNHVIATSVPIGLEEACAVMQNVSENAQWAVEHPDECVYLKYMIGSQIAGYVLVKQFWNLCCLFVDPALHGRGIGRALLVRAIQLGRHRTERTHMLVNASPNAVGFYRSLGFEHDESRQSRGSAVPMRLGFPA